MVNPYQPTEFVEAPGDRESRSKPIDERFDANERRTLRRGLAIIRAACAIVFGSIITLGGATLSQGTAPQISETIGVGWIVSLIGLSIAGVWSGLMTWTSLPGNQKAACYAAAIMLGLGLFATGSFVSRILDGAFVGNLFRLFGASSFALLLIAMAIAGLITRGFALSACSLLAARSSELAVVCYAISGAICSSHAMQYASQSDASLLFALFVVGPLAIALHWCSHHLLVTQLTARERFR